jgi:hypothetical protein
MFAIYGLVAETGLPPVWLQVTLSVLTVLGAFALAVAAVYGEWLKNRFLPARLAIRLSSDLGHYLPGMKRYYFGLKIRNRGWTVARNCRVMLYGFSKRGPDNNFHPVDMPIPIHLTWSPSQMPPAYRNVSRSKPETVDLGFIAGPGTRDCPRGFTAQAYVMPLDYPDLLSVGKGEAGRYCVGLEADDTLVCDQLTVEVSWDGVWDDDKYRFQEHFRIREVPSEEP